MAFHDDDAGWSRHTECMTAEDWRALRPPVHGCELPPSCPGCGATCKADHGEDCPDKGWPDTNETDEEDDE